MSKRGRDWFIADWHLNHGNIIKYCRRLEFMTDTERELVDMADRGAIRNREVKISPATTARMTTAVLENTNAVVESGDRLHILGDVLFARQDNKVALVKKYRAAIKEGVEVRLIHGNHDDRDLLRTHFADKYTQYSWESDAEYKGRLRREDVQDGDSHYKEQVLIRIDQQKLFMNHYPMRSWDNAHHGAWNLYGHVHDLYGYEDNGKLSPFFEHYYQNQFHGVLETVEGLNHVTDDVKAEIVRKLLSVVADNNGISLTCDVGVDNRVRGMDVPFGTPWSMGDLRKYFFGKMEKWKKRQDEFRGFVPSSAVGENGEKANLSC
jgi:calcineurin-like phosphoesterase family protein